jgi:hypothetical protein
MAQVLRTMCGPGGSLTGYVSHRPGFGDLLGLREKAFFLHVMPGGGLPLAGRFFFLLDLQGPNYSHEHRAYTRASFTIRVHCKFTVLFTQTHTHTMIYMFLLKRYFYDIKNIN